CGSALFYVYRFFPVTSLFLSVLLLGLTVWQNLNNIHHSIGRRLLSVSIVFLMVLLGFCSAYLRAVSLQPVSDVAGETILVEGTVRSEAVPLYSHPDSFSHIIDITDAVDKAGKHLSLGEMKVLSSNVMTAGMPYRITVHIPADAYFMNPGSRSGLSGYILGIEPVNSPPGTIWERPIKFFQASRARLNTAFKQSLSQESASFIMALITGERGLISEETSNAFNVTGLAHLLHKAGLHFGLLFLFLFEATRFFIKMLPNKLFSRLTLYASPSQIAALVSLPFMVWYLGISPPDFGTLRAFIMVCFFLFGLLIQRKGFWLNNLLTAVFIIVACQPDSLIALSFQLSVAAVLSIGLAAGGKREGNRHSLVSYIRSSLLVTVAANAGTAPLIINYFHTFSIVSPLTNLIIVPAVGFVILPLAFLSSFFFLFFNVLPFHAVLDSLTGHVLSLIYYMARWPFISLRIPAFPPVLLIFFYSGLVIFTALTYSRIKESERTAAAGAEESLPPRSGFSFFRSLAFPCSVALIPMLIFSVATCLGRDRLSVTFLDVGQGDGAVIELPDRRTLVMDTGNSGFQIGEFLRYRGVNEIEAIMLSHGHHDHTGGLEYLINTFKVHEIWDNNRLIYKTGILEKVGHRGLQRGDMIHGSGYTITVLHPYEGFYSASSNNSEENSEENNDSLVLRVQGTAASFLFTGDVEKEGEEDTAHTGPALKSTVLKVAHHGSRTSSSEVFVNAVSPEIAVISCGRKNRFGFPSDETLSMLDRCRVFRTDRDGAVGIREGDGSRMEVKTWKDFQITEVTGIRDEWMNIKRLFWVW
ncbi:MAG TPA: ComEC/Rec2 family competence protein, partial [Dissulfurispiraceae bacterium]|nr:ComEC/Rec2 family competence protein [Dissulfurispiraceae bacterium]